MLVRGAEPHDVTIRLPLRCVPLSSDGVTSGPAASRRLIASGPRSLSTSTAANRSCVIGESSSMSPWRASCSAVSPAFMAGSVVTQLGLVVFCLRACAALAWWVTMELLHSEVCFRYNNSYVYDARLISMLRMHTWLRLWPAQSGVVRLVRAWLRSCCTSAALSDRDMLTIIVGTVGGLVATRRSPCACSDLSVTGSSDHETCCDSWGG